MVIVLLDGVSDIPIIDSNTCIFCVVSRTDDHPFIMSHLDSRASVVSQQRRRLVVIDNNDDDSELL